MAVPTFHINISGTVVALYGAVLATATGIVQIVNFFRDRRKVKISVQADMEIVSAASGKAVHGNIAFTVVTVANAGRRPITIVNVGGYRLFPGKGFVVQQCTPPLPRELTEGKHLTALVDESQLDLSKMESWEASDAVGHKYRLPIAPFYKRLVSRMRRKWSLRKDAANKAKKLTSGQ
jgi:hypothetical protein